MTQKKPEQQTAKINTTSPDMNAERLAELRRLFPDLFDGEGQLDEKALRQIVQPDQSTGIERFRFEWAGKQDSKRHAFTPSKATLVADKKRSVDFDKTQNLIIEGDNLEALKLLQATYFEQVKCIYIDPPYNTTNDFIYPDDYTESKKAYWQKNGTVKDGVKLVANSEAAGRKHSNWLNMMQSRLLLARQLLRPDGVIFISIDDNEQCNLKKLCDEVFGEENFIATFPWRKRTAKSDVPFGVSQDFEWVMAYAKSDFMAGQKIERKYYYTDDFEQGWRLSDLTTQRNSTERPNSFFDMLDPKTEKAYPANPNRVWGVSKDTFDSYYKKGKIVFPDDYDFLNISRPAYRVFENEDAAKSLKKHGSETPIKAISTLLPTDVGRTEDGTKEITELFSEKLFPFPKPLNLFKFLIEVVNDRNAIVVDFFAGSGGMGQAIMQANQADGGNRKFVLVQIPEYTEEKTAAYKAGYKTISELCIERVKRAGEKIEEEHPDADIDTGFRVYRLTDSHFPENLFKSDPDKSDADNMAALQAHLKTASQTSLFKEDELADIITEISLKNGYGLFFTLEQIKGFKGNTVYRLSGNGKDTLLCLDETLQDTSIEMLVTDHAEGQLIVTKRALDTAKTWTLQNAFGDNLRVV